MHWLQTSTTGLLLLCAAAIAVLLFLIIKVKLEPFIALFISGIGLALVAGLSVEEMVGTALSSSESLIETGFGGVLGHIALIIGLGTVLGSLLERSGGADVLASRLIGFFGERGTPVAMGLVGLIFGIPVFFDIGIFVLAPLVYVAAHRGGRSLVLYALPVLAGLSMTHAFLPPHPGPTALGGLLGVDLGWLIIMGLLCGLPAFAAAGILFPMWVAPRVPVSVPEDLLVAETEAEKDAETTTAPVSLALVLGVIAVPLVLILGATFGTMLLDPGRLLSVLTFLGNPAVALTIAVLLAFWLLGIRRGMSLEEISEFTGASLRPVGMILLVVGAGAFFGAVISATGVGAALAEVLSDAGLPVLLLAYVISCALRIAQGSATVAIVTTGGIIAPTLGSGYSQPELAVIAVAIAAGSIVLSHVNDGGFWIVSRYFNMSVKQTLATWTVLETVLSLVGFVAAAIVWAIV
ncbi:GntP family gluconate:H+ symporter [Nocardioides luteus]|uniref:Gluconate:proton symporter n=1 Tax=Nocardioides luteus TaxID=1844 RepID=A0ABQ5SZP2_9ACTN|nr:gluconate:H+ symporter [Nocardioides luteus]MDR7310929.1 GntP family gluconate:H+ symporter [Nocardioides luteus]GGR39692.1 gluconate:proton symporter [Nocardioides luteus]GLJ69291.1 gluconate:proton symporter [Nocardioides luteus]